jgi:diguanylate cyclase (GGDEF)-like protein
MIAQSVPNTLGGFSNRFLAFAIPPNKYGDVDECKAKKITAFFYDNVDFLRKSVCANPKIILRETWPAAVGNSDLFIINIDHPNATECCFNLRLRKANKYKPIIFTYDKNSEDKVGAIANLDIGFSDIVNCEANPSLIRCRLNAAASYQKLRETYFQKLQKSLYLSSIDSATETYSRSFLEEYLKKEEFGASKAAVLMLDVDKFKSINDTFGHSFADLMLKYVSNTIKKYVRSSDIVARYGGDEFVIIINNVTKAEANNIADRICKKISAQLFYGAKCAVSVGVRHIASKNAVSLREAIEIADKSMYAAKRSGGNSVEIC